jgi:hypothetical protein
MNPATHPEEIRIALRIRFAPDGGAIVTVEGTERRAGRNPKGAAMTGAQSSPPRDTEAERVRALRYLGKHGPASSSHLRHKGWNLPEGEREKILTGLVAEGVIIADAVSHGTSGGRPTTRYRLA